MLAWKEQAMLRGAPEHYLISGGIPVAIVTWDSGASREDGSINKYKWRLLLPGKERNGVADGLLGAKSYAELAFAGWCKAAGLRRA